MQEEKGLRFRCVRKDMEAKIRCLYSFRFLYFDDHGRRKTGRRSSGFLS